MVKTRGLGCALGRVVARGLGRGDGDDSHGAPQRRRPTTSARRRRVPILIDDVVPAVPADSPTVPEAEANVAGDEPMVDAVVQDTGAETDAQDTSAQDAADEPEGFPGGPRDPSVLTEYADHVAASEHPELKLSSHGRKVNNLGRLVPAIGDMPLRSDEAVLLLVELLMVSAEVAMAETGQCGGPYVRLQWLRDSWIYEHFASVAKCNADPDYDEVSPRACQWIETKKTVKKFHWEPVVVRYRPKRVMRQFGYVQCIPTHPVHSWVSYDDVDNTWTHYSDHLAAAGDLCVVLGQCAPDYIDWFFIISHPFMTAPQTDPPRDAYATQPSHIPHEAAPASTHADPDADEPRHAVACHAIAEALEQHLNASGTSTHEEVIQKCLRISRGVTEDRNVYVHKEIKTLEVKMPRLRDIPKCFVYVNEGGFPIFKARGRLREIPECFDYVNEGGFPVFKAREVPNRCFSVCVRKTKTKNFGMGIWEDAGVGMGNDWKTIQVYCETELTVCSWGVCVYKHETNIEDIQITSEVPSSTLVRSLHALKVKYKN
ncbi:hypothetical protein GmHk_04G010452 [Glycine max]|nr:hypothetical protein GmHk_04G010452 [Glycine max]